MKLNYENANINKFADLLEVWNIDRFIIICPINKIYNTTNINDISNWNNTIKRLKVNKENSHMNRLPDINKSLTYINNYFNRNNLPLAVVEVDNLNDYLVRGIISKEDNLKVSINPIYNDIRPKTIIEKYNLVFSDEITYLKDIINDYNNKKIKTKKQHTSR